MDYYAQTKRYYGLWTNVDPDRFDHQGITCVQSSERDKVQDGYTKRFELYIMCRGNGATICYGSNGASIADTVCQFYENSSSLEDFVDQLRNMESLEVSHALKFYLSELQDIKSDSVVQLKLDQYSDYREC